MEITNTVCVFEQLRKMRDISKQSKDGGEGVEGSKLKTEYFLMFENLHFPRMHDIYEQNGTVSH